MCCVESRTSAHPSQNHQGFINMNAFQALLCLALVAASCAATLETALNSENGGKSDQDTKLRAAVVLLSKTIEDWLDAHPDEDPSETLTHLGKLLEEADVTEALAKEDDEGREPDSDVAEYGFGKKFKKWLKKAGKIAANAAKAAAINKAIGAVAAAMG
ncbi:uncharacterized protein LOC144169314 isoform X2 [Haemaphysalis longicornis]